MTSSWKHSFRLQSVLSSWDKAVLITLTTKDVVGLSELRRRWRDFRHDYLRRLDKGAKYISIFERHPKGHGWHVHFCVNRGYLPVGFLRSRTTYYGFGRIQIEKLYNPQGMGLYLAKYLSKSIKRCRAHGVKRVRIVNLSRGLSTLKDLVCESSLFRNIRDVIRSREIYPELRSVPLWSLFRHLFNMILFGEYYTPVSKGLMQALLL